MEILYNGITDSGLKRKVNQDVIGMFCHGEVGLYFVADGMGGHASGEVASGMIRDGMSKWWQGQKDSWDPGRFEDYMESLNQELLKVNREIWENFNQGQVCGSTVVILFLCREKYGVLSVGDSRIYSYESGNMRQLTVAHVWENLEETKQRYTVKEQKEHKYYGKLTQAVGTKESVGIFKCSGYLKKNQRFFLCSDGLYRYCEEGKMIHILSNIKDVEDTRSALYKLRKEGYTNGAPDNLSAIIVYCKNKGSLRLMREDIWKRVGKALFRYELK